MNAVLRRLLWLTNKPAWCVSGTRLIHLRLAVRYVPLHITVELCASPLDSHFLQTSIEVELDAIECVIVGRDTFAPLLGAFVIVATLLTFRLDASFDPLASLM